MRKLYLAGPLFSEAEIAFNLGMRDLLKKYFDVYLPQEDGGLMVDMLKQGVPLDAAQQLVFSSDVTAMRAADYVLIILDGRSVDEGAAFELGFAYAIGKTCIAYQSDPRRLLPSGNNPMLECAVSDIFSSKSELRQWAAAESAPCQSIPMSVGALHDLGEVTHAPDEGSSIPGD